MAAPSMRFATYGESMIRYAPLNGNEEWRGKASSAAPVLRSVGGDELNVSVALGRLGWKSVTWASVVPSGPYGEMIRSSGMDAGVSMDHCKQDQGGEVGTYTVLPEEAKTHFQRTNSSFAKQGENLVDWNRILSAGLTWVHLTGIAPMCCEAAARCWAAGFDAATKFGSPISVDLNHRPQQGTLEKLWGIASPQIPRIHLFILSVASVFGLAEVLGVSDDAADSPAGKRPRIAGVAAKAGDGTTESVLPVLKKVHSKLNGPAVACCLKERDQAGVQKRWSIIIDAGGVHSTEAVPTFHNPKDECGGGSAWAAGAVDKLASDVPTGKFERRGSLVKLGANPVAVARRADLLAALCQEVVGDHSNVSRETLLSTERTYAGTAAHIGHVNGSSSLSADEALARVHRALAVLDKAKVIGIIRAKNEAKAIQRAKELADLGFPAIEVTADSVGFAEETLLPAVTKAVGDRLCVGVGTITTMKQLEVARRGGAHFALSPVRPSTSDFGSLGFVRQCHAMGILAMPAAFSPQEIYECVEVYGALTVKLFPADLLSPKSLASLRRIGKFGAYRLCPSGGIDATNIQAWLSAGACCCGMGAGLVGKDVGVAPEDADALKAAEDDWTTKGRPAAAELAKRLYGKD